MATHSSILAWRIPWTEKPDGLLSLGSQSQTQLKQLSTHSEKRELSDDASYLIYETSVS